MIFCEPASSHGSQSRTFPEVIDQAVYKSIRIFVPIQKIEEISVNYVNGVMIQAIPVFNLFAIAFVHAGYV